MHYFIDGYNLLFRTVDIEEELKGHRDALLRELTERCELLNLNVTIVFDAAYQPGGVSRSRSSTVEIVYTGLGETADAYIVAELLAMPRVRNETVVTSDKPLAADVRRCGGFTVEVGTFLAWLGSCYRNKLRKLRKKSKDFPTPKIAKTRVAPAKKEEPPQAKQTPEGCLEYYLKAFETHVESEPERPPTTPILSEHERWLRLFMRQLDEDSRE